MKRGRVDALEEVRGGNPSLTVATADDHGRFQRQHAGWQDRKSTRLNSSHPSTSYAVFCLKKKMTIVATQQGRTSSTVHAPKTACATQPSRSSCNLLVTSRLRPSSPPRMRCVRCCAASTQW